MMDRRLTYSKSISLTPWATFNVISERTVLESNFFGSGPNRAACFDKIVAEVRALGCYYLIEQVLDPITLEERPQAEREAEGVA